MRGRCPLRGRQDRFFLADKFEAGHVSDLHVSAPKSIQYDSQILFRIRLESAASCDRQHFVEMVPRSEYRWRETRLRWDQDRRRTTNACSKILEPTEEDL